MWQILRRITAKAAFLSGVWGRFLWTQPKKAPLGFAGNIPCARQTIVISSSPAFTGLPGSMNTSPTLPSMRATTLVSIFMASMMASTWFTLTSSPGLTLTLLTMPGMEAPTWPLSSGSAMATFLAVSAAVGSGTETSRREPLSSKTTLRVPSSFLSPRPRYFMTRVLPSSMFMVVVSPSARPSKKTWLPMRMM